jgi:hypothetical protein
MIGNAYVMMFTFAKSHTSEHNFNSCLGSIGKSCHGMRVKGERQKCEGKYTKVGKKKQIVTRGALFLIG